MSQLKVFIVDDHQLFRNGLKFLLNEIEQVKFAGEASNGKEFLELLKVFKPDIVLMDIKMPVMDGIEATKKALEIYPDLKIIVLSMFGDDSYYNTMIDLGVKGFLLKDSDNDELKTALTRIAEGQTYFSQELLLKLIKGKTNNSDIQLTLREQEVLKLICKGYSTSEIADELNISQRTVERHRSSLLFKTESSNSIKLVLYAIRNNLVDIS